MKLKDYIKSKGLTQRAFAKLQGVKPSQITQWINKDFIVIDKVMYSERRKINEC